MTREKRRRLIYNTITFAVIIIAFFVLQSMIEAKTITRSLKGQLVPICCWIVMAVSLNLVIGISGELSLGHAGFMSVGAYTGAVVSGFMLNALNVQDTTLRLVIAIVAGGLMSGITGVLIGIPVLRLRGDYLAIVTLAFGEIIKSIFNNLYLGFDAKGFHISLLQDKTRLLEGGKLIIAGPMGISGIRKISTFTEPLMPLFALSTASTMSLRRILMKYSIVFLSLSVRAGYLFLT